MLLLIATTLSSVHPLGMMQAGHAVLRYTKHVLCHFRLIALACGSALLAIATWMYCLVLSYMNSPGV